VRDAASEKTLKNEEKLAAKEPVAGAAGGTSWGLTTIFPDSSKIANTCAKAMFSDGYLTGS